jgi:hypothetical protein
MPTQHTPGVQAGQSDALIPLGYLFAVLVPFVGLILGVLAATRAAGSAARRQGPWIIATATVAFAIWAGMIYAEIYAAQHHPATQAAALPDKEEAEQRWCTTHTPNEPPGSPGCSSNENVRRLEQGEAPE